MFENLGAALRELRARAGLSQNALATAASLSRSSIYQFEAGQVRPSVETLGRLLSALGSSLKDLERALMDHPGGPPRDTEQPTGAIEPDQPAETYPLFGHHLSREEIERRLDAAFDRVVREALEAEPEATEEVRERARRQPRPAGVRDE